MRRGRGDYNQRRGAAALELVLSMPVLITIIVGIVWLGASVVAQTEVTIEARHKTWSQRDGSDGTSLLFLKDDIVSDDATTTVDVSPIFEDLDSPESSHNVMAGAWDHESLALDKAPNWKKYAIAAANAKTGSAQVGYVDARNKFSQFQSTAGNLWNQIAVDLIRQITNLGGSADSALNGGSSDRANEAEERAEIERKLSAKRAELRAARRQLRELDDDASDAMRDILKNKVERLRAEVDELEADRKALD